MSAASSNSTIDCIVVGASGYVGGELLRLIAGHPQLEIRGALSRSLAGTPVSEVIPHLRPAYPTLAFASPDDLAAILDAPGPVAVFGAAPHGESAALLDGIRTTAAKLDRPTAIVDTSADFRLRDVNQYESTYGCKHGAPELLKQFHCGLPDIEAAAHTGSKFVAHPGCFTTAVSLACAPLHALGLTEPEFFVSAVTGSTGSGRQPKPGTHHPQRHGNLRAYTPLVHRHAAEMEALVGAEGEGSVQVAFVPHSGPFARGIHATVHARFHEPMTTSELCAKVSGYHQSPFVIVEDSPPQLKDVIGTNLCRIGVAAQGHHAVVCSVIDNLTKGAAGGALQWMNSLLDLDTTLGLNMPGTGWT